MTLFSVSAATPPCGHMDDAALPETATPPVEGGENLTAPGARP